MTKDEKIKIELQNRRKLKLIIIGIAISVIVIFTACMFSIINLYQKNTNLKKELKYMTSERDAYNTENTSAQEELAKMKARIAGIKNNDDLLRRDIELYITYNYNKISKTVAKTIALNIIKESNEQDMSPELIMGIMQVESVFNPMQVGKKTKYGHARGLMQVMPEWVKKFNLKSKHDLHDIDTNIKSGVRVFNIHLKEANGNISKGLYLYVNKDKAYINKVYTAVGKFVSFRSTVDDDEKSEEVEAETNEIPKQNKTNKKEIPKKDESDETTKKSVR
jgi:hypothetical protein